VPEVLSLASLAETPKMIAFCFNGGEKPAALKYAGQWLPVPRFTPYDFSKGFNYYKYFKIGHS
jgi:hypothetical protein